MEFDPDWMRAFIARNQWVYAKTMPEHPHEYATRKRVANDADFDRFVLMLRAHGYRRRFFKNVYTSLDLDHWTYWTMGASLYTPAGLPYTIIINRTVAAPYHTALGKTVPLTAHEALHTDQGLSTAFVHDILTGLPGIYYGCDLLYSEIPWQSGWEVFLDRAGAPEFPPYGQFMQTIAGIINTVQLPHVVVTGHQAQRWLPYTEDALPMQLNGEPAVAYGYRLELPAAIDTEKLLERLAVSFDRVGDYCCGYGRAGRIFAQHGKLYTMSDINRSCIGYIALNSPGWTTPAHHWPA